MNFNSIFVFIVVIMHFGVQGERPTLRLPVRGLYSRTSLPIGHLFYVLCALTLVLQPAYQSESQAAMRSRHPCLQDCNEACHVRGRNAGVCVAGICRCRTARGT